MQRLYYVLFVLAVISCSPKEKSVADSAPGDSVKDGAAATTRILKSNHKASKDCALRSDVEIPADISQYLLHELLDVRLARIRDFAPEWCHFYEDKQVPYYVEGNFDNDAFIEKAMIFTTDDGTKINIAVIDQLKDHKYVMIPLETWEETRSLTDEPQAPQFTFGLYTTGSGESYRTETDSTFNIPRPHILISYFKKATTAYYWSPRGYKKVNAAADWFKK